MVPGDSSFCQKERWTEGTDRSLAGKDRSPGSEERWICVPERSFPAGPGAKEDYGIFVGSGRVREFDMELRMPRARSDVWKISQSPRVRVSPF